MVQLFAILSLTNKFLISDKSTKSPVDLLHPAEGALETVLHGHIFQALLTEDALTVSALLPR